MPSKFENYRFTKRTPLSDEVFNRIFADLDLRITGLEDVKKSWEGVVEEVSEYGILRIEQVLRPNWELIESKKEQAISNTNEILVLRELADEVIYSNRDSVVQEISNLKSQSLLELGLSKTTALSDITSARSAALSDISSAKTMALSEIIVTKNEAIEAVEDVAEDVINAIGVHNTSSSAHSDIRTTISNIISGTTTVGNAEKVGNYLPSQTPGANKILVAQSNGKIHSDWLPITSSVMVVSFSYPGNAVVGTNVTPPVVIQSLPQDKTIALAVARCLTAPTGAALIFDIKKNGTSIWSGQPTWRVQIAAGQTYGQSNQFVTSTVSNGDYFTLDIVQRGSTVAGANIFVGLYLI